MLNTSATLNIFKDMEAAMYSLPDKINTISSLKANVPTIAGTAIVINALSIIEDVSTYCFLFSAPR